MSIKSLIQVVAMIAAIAFMNGQSPDILKRVQIAKVHLIKASKSSNWEKAMFP